MACLFLLFVFLHAERAFAGLEKRPPGFYRVFKGDDGKSTFIPISTASAKGTRVLHNGKEITAFDFREATDSEQVQHISNQNPCGNCWAHAMADLNGVVHYLNSFDAINPAERFNKVVSNQYLTNCYGSGCGGGISYYYEPEFAQLGSVEEDCVPSISYYDGQYNCSTQCGSDPGTACTTCCAKNPNRLVSCPVKCADSCTDTSKVFKRHIDEKSEFYTADKITDMGFLRQLLITSGPALAGVDGTFTLDNGIYKCPNEFNINHEVVIYGFGVQDNTNYWLVKNSWGSGWGENGFFKIKMGTNECGIENGWQVLNNYYNSSRPRKGVPLPEIQPTPNSEYWHCQKDSPSCVHVEEDYITDGSEYVPLPLPPNPDYLEPGNLNIGEGYYVNTTGTGDCLSLSTQCTIAAALSKVASPDSKVLHLSAEVFSPGIVTVSTEKHYSFVGDQSQAAGMTELQTTHGTLQGQTNSNWYAWAINTTAGSLYFSNMIVKIMQDCEGCAAFDFLTVFFVKGLSAQVNCSYIDFRFNEQHSKGVVLELWLGEVCFSNCLLANGISSCYRMGMFSFFGNETIERSLILQNFTVENFTIGTALIRTMGHKETCQRLSIIKCTFANINGTREPSSFTRPNDYRWEAPILSTIPIYTDDAQSRYSIRYGVEIRGTVFRSINGSAGAFSAGALFFSHKNLDNVPILTDCIFVGCTGRCGGVAFTIRGEQKYLNCTFAGNSYTATDNSYTYRATDLSVNPSPSNELPVFYHNPMFLGSCSTSDQPRIKSTNRVDLSNLLPTCGAPAGCEDIPDEANCTSVTPPGKNAVPCFWVREASNANKQGACHPSALVTCPILLDATQCADYGGEDSPCMWMGSSGCMLRGCGELSTANCLLNSSCTITKGGMCELKACENCSGNSDEDAGCIVTFPFRILLPAFVVFLVIEGYETKSESAGETESRRCVQKSNIAGSSSGEGAVVEVNSACVYADSLPSVHAEKNYQNIH